jgi:hypothetical protein
MRKCICGLSLAALVLIATGSARTQDAKDSKAIIDKAIKALGGEEKLSKAVKGATWKTKGVVTFGGNDNPISTENTLKGLDHYKSVFMGEFGGNKIEGVTVVAGDKGWRSFAGMDMEMDKDGIASEKRNLYLSIISALIVPLKDKGFKSEVTGEQKVENKAAVVLKVTGPDGKDSTLYLDKDSGLPIRQVAKVNNFMGQEVTQETTYSDFKEMGGIKLATKTIIKHDGEKVIEMGITEFKVLDKVDPKTFDKP